MHIPIIFSFARSGGTLVNQLLGIHPDCLVLSEVNPAGSVVSVARQAVDWLGLLEEDEVDQFQELPYSQQIAVLDEHARSLGKTLIIRDWVTANYLPGAGGSSIVSSGILEQSLYLSRIGYSLRPLVVTRKAGFIYRSIKKNFIHMADLSLNDFSSSYLAYARAVTTFPKVALEAIQASPRETLLQILQLLGLSTEHVDIQLDKFSEFSHCTGNNTLANRNKTPRVRRIVPGSSNSLTTSNLVDKEVFREVDLLMGYET